MTHVRIEAIQQARSTRAHCCSHHFTNFTIVLTDAPHRSCTNSCEAVDVPVVDVLI